jgi:hypothetical protein
MANAGEKVEFLTPGAAVPERLVRVENLELDYRRLLAAGY